MSKYIVIYCLVVVILNQIGINFALPTELEFQGEIYHIGNRAFKQLRIAKQCTGNKLGLHVPYNAVKFFWSGFGVADSDKVAAEIAQYVAGKEGKRGVTLEMLLEMKENVHIKPCKWTIPPTPECQQFWYDLSCEYATATKGEVRSIVGPKLNPNGAWLKTEKNQLEYNRSTGQDLWGFKEYELENIYCKDMRVHNTKIPEIKSQVCSNGF